MRAGGDNPCTKFEDVDPVDGRDIVKDVSAWGRPRSATRRTRKSATKTLPYPQSGPSRRNAAADPTTCSGDDKILPKDIMAPASLRKCARVLYYELREVKETRDPSVKRMKEETQALYLQAVSELP